MRQRHIQSEAFHARATLEWCGIRLGSDFHILRSNHVDALLVCADQARYQKPKNANGSRARYFHDMLQRRAKLFKKG
jgi:hypothetical protein